ncbi:DUF998 domain-containing protein [Pseudonocardia sp. CA-107938]|uniref:DUF998 domain-containing protein n=1 Tax=Pseudonocardia sp. CA-107938 TaxID=3240021 RepID=UPI003D8FF620
MRAKALLYAGVVAGPLFIVAVLLEGATRAGYSPLRHPISSLALGEGGWMQTATFLITGALSLAAAAGPCPYLASAGRHRRAVGRWHDRRRCTTRWLHHLAYARRGGWRAYSLLTGAVFLVWLTALAVRALRQPAQPAL